MKLLSSSPCPIYHLSEGRASIPRCQSPNEVTKSEACSPRVSRVVGADRDALSGDDSPTCRWACPPPLQEGADRRLQRMAMLPACITVFLSVASCLVLITSTASAGADAFKNPECFTYQRFMWFVTGRSQSCSSNYFLLIITTSTLCLLFYATT